jgi:mannose-1-phosphate guanylyltransferase
VTVTRALILAGGKATRLRPLTLTTPKAMTQVLGRPFLEHMLAWQRSHDVREVTLLLGYLAGPIREHFGDGSGFGVRLSYVTEDEPLGSGGAIKQLEAELTEPFFAINGDIYTDLDLRAMAAAHAAAGAEVTIALTPVEDPSQYGVVALDGDRRITRFVEKPPKEEAPSDLVNAGVWLFQPAAVERIVAGRFSMVEQELFPDLARAGRLLGYTADCYWMDAGTPARYLQLHRDLLSGVSRSPLPLVERVGRPGLVCASPLAQEDGPPPVVDEAAVIDGPCVLSAGVTVGERAAIAGPASLGRGVIVEEGAFVADSVLWDGCRIDRHARVIGSVLAAGCVVETAARVEESVLGDGVCVAAEVEIRGASVDPPATPPSPGPSPTA